MTSRFLVFALVVLLLAFAVLATSMNIKSAYAADDLWYVGEGVKQDMYVKYRIQELDTVGDNPYVMTIYFKEHKDGNWIAPTFVEYNGKVIQGTLKLADNMAILSGGPGVPAEMMPFINGYSGSLEWLDAFATKSKPQSLHASYWGKIASIGGPPVSPAGAEKVSFAGAKDLCGADSCDSTVILWHKGVDNKIWVVNEFPFPVKAEAFAEDVTGRSQYQFKFELLGTGTGQPTSSVSKEEIPKPPLTEKTSRKGYIVELTWDPVEIRSNSTVKFGITMLDKSRFPLDNVNYDFIVKDSSGKMVKELRNQKAEIGIGTHEVTFNNDGSMTVTVIVTSVNGQFVAGTTGQIESADFNVVVVPEFPVSTTIVVATVIGLVILMMRARGAGLGGQPDGKNAPL